MISSKGFLFTVSIILFATTLVTYTQVYSESVSSREFLIIESYKSKIVPFFIDDISTDILSILKLNFDAEFSENEAQVEIKGKLPQENIETKFNLYKNFLETIYFNRFQGDKNIDFSSVFEDKFIINFPTNIFVYDYDNSKIILKNSFNLLDLNLFVNNNDLNGVESNFVAGAVPISVNYFDDQNIISFSQDINLSSESYIKFIYLDSNLLIRFGASDEEYFVLDSDIDSNLNYSLKVINSFDNNYFNANSNIIVKYRTDQVDSNSFVKIN